MARSPVLSQAQVTAVRTVAGAIGADSVTLTDANIDPTKAVDCAGYDTIWVGVEIAGGSSPTATLEVLVRDADAVTDSGTAVSSRWKRLLVGANDGVSATALGSQKTGALDGFSFQEVRVNGRKVFLRIDAVTNPGSTTAMTILAMPGKVRSRVELHT